MTTGDRHSDLESSDLATARQFHCAATLAERRRVSATPMSIDNEAWRVVLLIGSGGVASAQIGKAIMAAPVIVVPVALIGFASALVLRRTPPRSTNASKGEEHGNVVRRAGLCSVPCGADRRRHRGPGRQERSPFAGLRRNTTRPRRQCDLGFGELSRAASQRTQGPSPEQPIETPDPDGHKGRFHARVTPTRGTASRAREIVLVGIHHGSRRWR